MNSGEKINSFAKKKINSHLKNWLVLLKSLEKRSKISPTPNYCNLYAYAANNPVHYTDPDGRTNKKYGITFIFYKEDSVQESKRINRHPGWNVETKKIKETTTITFYGNNETILKKFKKKNLNDEHVVWDCEESYLPDDVQELLKNSNDDVIVETEKKSIKTYYQGLLGTEQTQEIKEKIKAIYFVNEKGEITKVLTNENENK